MRKFGLAKAAPLHYAALRSRLREALIKISPTYRRLATITDINNRNQVSCVLIFSDTFTVSEILLEN